MLGKRVRAIGAALLLFCLGGAPAAAQTGTRLSWLADLAGACWQGRTADGATLDRQCYQLQFSRFLRGSIARGELHGDSVLGWSRERLRFEMYTWANSGEPSVFTPVFDDGSLIYEGAVEDGQPTRAVWRRVDADTFTVTDQIRDGQDWRDRRVVTYRRDGPAPAAFSAGAGASATGGGWNWLDQLAGRCFRQIEPARDANSRGCFAWQYPTVLRQTWYWDHGAPTAETVMFRAPGQRSIRFYYWDAQGQFGVGSSTWDRNLLLSMTDSEDDARRILQRRGSGFSITTEVLEPPPGAVWVYHHHYRFAPE